MLEMMSKLQNYYVPVNARHGNTCLYSTVMMMITVGRSRRYISLTGCRSGLDTSLWVASIFLLFRIAVHSMSTKGAFSMDTQ